MKDESSFIPGATVASLILSLFGIYVCRDSGFGWEYGNFWQCCTKLGGWLWLILFLLGAIYVLAMYVMSDKKVHISYCAFPIVEIIGLFVMKGKFNDLCLILLDAEAGFSLWGWLMLGIAIILALYIIYCCVMGESEDGSAVQNNQ